MQTITKYLVPLIFSLSLAICQGQEISITDVNEKIEALERQKERVKIEEREALKKEVEAINERLEKGSITKEEADKLKKEAAKNRALNIENKLAILDNKIELLKRDSKNIVSVEEDFDDDRFTIRIGGSEDTNDSFIFIGNRRYDKPRKYDRRTTSDFVLAFGLNNTLIEGQSLDDSPYKFGGSRFFEIGWAWKTRVFKNSNWLRLKYGYSFQINGLKPTDNQYFVDNNGQTNLEVFEHDLKKSKLSVSNLVFPVHFEFGPSRKIERKKYFRYSTRRQFKIGIGGYAGFNIGTRQKLKYTADGEKVKDKIKRDYNTTNLVYGISSYVAIGDVALYAKYDLSPLFKDQTVEQRNISLGLRFDMD